MENAQHPTVRSGKVFGQKSFAQKVSAHVTSYSAFKSIQEQQTEKWLDCPWAALTDARETDDLGPNKLAC